MVTLTAEAETIAKAWRKKLDSSEVEAAFEAVRDITGERPVLTLDTPGFTKYGLRDRGFIVDVRRGAVHSVTFCVVRSRNYGTFVGIDRVVPGLRDDASREDVLAVLGEPADAQERLGDQYPLEGRKGLCLNLRYSGGQLSMVRLEPAWKKAPAVQPATSSGLKDVPVNPRIRGHVHTLVAAIDHLAGDPEVTALTDLVGTWTSQPTHEVPHEGPKAFGWSEAGVAYRYARDRLWYVTVNLTQNRRSGDFSPFTHLPELIDGLPAGCTRETARAVLGMPVETQGRWDTYLVGDGLVLVLEFDAEGVLDTVQVKDPGRTDRRALIKKAITQAEGPTGKDAGTIAVRDEDGIFALADLVTYDSYLGSWDFDSLGAHLAREMTAGHVVPWRTGADSSVDVVIDVRPRTSRRKAHRKGTASIEVTNGRLHVVSYTHLTMAAEDVSPGVLPQDEAMDWFLDVENGRYDVVLRKLFDPQEDDDKEKVIELVLTPREQELPPEQSPLWWS